MPEIILSMTDAVLPTLLKVFHKIDPDFKEISRSVSSNSVYYRVGVLKVRVSDHLKKDVDDLEKGSINLVKFPGSRSYLVSMKGSVFMKQVSIKKLEPLIRSEIERLQNFFPEEIQEFAEPVKFADVPATVKASGEEGTYVKYRNCEDVRKYCDMAIFGNIVKCIYGEIQVKYKSGQAKKIWKKLTGKTSYEDLKNIIQNELKQAV